MKTKIVFFYLIISIIHVNMYAGSYKDKPVRKEVQELKERKGLPNFFEKVLNGDTIKIAYLGGSITAQNGWRTYSFNWFQQRFPNAVFSQINAAIGGTGSDFGVFRLKEHVLRFNPDLLFIEFAANDGGRPDEEIIRSMEGIVRQTWQYNPHTDICFIYTITGSFIEDEMNGMLPPSAITMEKIADQYGIPTINFGYEVCKMLNENQLIFKGNSKELNDKKVFSPDGIHPYPETGHAIYHTAFMRSFEKMVLNKHIRSKKHLMPKPLSKDYFSKTEMINLSEAKLSKNWEIFKTEDHPSFSVFGRYLKTIGKANQSGETLAVSFKGKTIGIYDIMGPDAGRVIVEVDGLVKDTISRFDKACTYRRINYFLIDHLEDKDHKVVFRVLSEPFDKAAILQKGKRVMNNPDDYKENNWYVGKILIDGYLEKFN